MYSMLERESGMLVPTLAGNVASVSEGVIVAVLDVVIGERFAVGSYSSQSPGKDGVSAMFISSSGAGRR